MGGEVGAEDRVLVGGGREEEIHGGAWRVVERRVGRVLGGGFLEVEGGRVGGGGGEGDADDDGRL